MMKAADSRQSNDSGLRRRPAFGSSAYRGILQFGVNSVGVVIVDVFAEESSKVVLVQDDHVIEQLSASTPDPSFGNPILPRASEGRSSRLDSKILDRLCDSF